jgi:hypothetical protein
MSSLARRPDASARSHALVAAALRTLHFAPPLLPPFTAHDGARELVAPFREPPVVHALGPGELRVAVRLSIAASPPPVLVYWQVASDPRFRRLERYGLRHVQAADGFALEVTLLGLEPGRPYWVRLWAGGSWSPTTQLRTGSYETRERRPRPLRTTRAFR